MTIKKGNLLLLLTDIITALSEMETKLKLHFLISSAQEPVFPREDTVVEAVRVNR